jgi:diguanylate cyclase (GGDEF)-like protein
MMRRGGTIIGAISAQAYPKNAYGDEDLRTLELIAAHAAIVIDNARYYREAVRDADRRAALYEASQRMSDKLDIEQLYLAIHDSVSRLMPCEAFLISLQTATDRLEHLYIFDKGQRLPAEVSSAREGMIGYAIAAAESLRIDDLSQVDPARFVVVKVGAAEQRTHSALVALMRRGGKSIGAISTQSYTTSAYTEVDLHVLELLAVHAAIAIDNARLFAKTQLYATIDELTQIYNRRYLMDHVQLEFERAKTEKAVLSLIMLDVDFFKRINDGSGHLVGDQILKGICEACQAHLRSTDIFGRFGGEEFVVALPDTTVLGAQRIAERLRVASAKVKAHTRKGEVGVTVSFGIAELTRSLEVLSEDERGAFTIDNLIDQADQALYAAKRAGRNRVCLYPEDVSDA